MKLLIAIVLFVFTAVKADQVFAAVNAGQVHYCQWNTTTVDLFGQNLDAFPDLHECAGSLTHLDLSNNMIASIPPWIGNFTYLEEILLNNNQLQGLPAAIGNLPNLRVLWVNNNQLQSLPASIGQLSQLRVLRVSMNNLQEIPADIENLQYLEELYVDRNSLAHLPVQIGWLSNLISLAISNNMLMEIPAEFGRLTNLVYLEAYGNQYNCVPRSVKRLPRLSYGWTSYNPACKNHTIDAYLTNRIAQRGTCGGLASRINGTALGCMNYVHTTCVMNEEMVYVTKRTLSDLSSRGLSCAPDAPQTAPEEVLAFPRCDPQTGAAASCGGPNADANVQRRTGLVTLEFENWDSCGSFQSDADPMRRLTAEVAPASASADSAAAAVATNNVAVAAAPSITRGRTIAEYTASVETARAVDAKAKHAALAAKKAATDWWGAVCDAGATSFLLTDTMNADLSACQDTLTVLTIDGGDFSMVAQAVLQLRNLQELTLHYTGNTQLPDELSQLRQLTTLTMHGCYLDQWPPVLQFMPQLTNLTMASVGVWWLPFWLPKLRNLIHLDLSFNSIYDLGDEIGQLVNLQTLIAPYCNVYTLTPKVDRLTHLRTLSLQGNNYLRLPATLANLKELRSVDLDYTYFPCVPDAVRAMPVLVNKHYFDYTPSCEAVPRPIGYSQTRNEACHWNPYYGFWYKAACNGATNKLSVTMYADSACKQQAKRKASHNLQDFARVGECSAHYAANGTATASYMYCHN